MAHPDILKIVLGEQMPDHQTRIQRKDGGVAVSEFKQGYDRALGDMREARALKLEIATADGAVAPVYANENAVGFDLAANETVYIPPHTRWLVDTGIIVRPPDGYFVMVVGRSSLAKRGLMLANNVGIIDPDYSGPTDVVKLQILNFSDQLVTVLRGERLAQGMLMPHLKADIVPFEASGESRGGIGSTGR